MLSPGKPVAICQRGVPQFELSPKRFFREFSGGLAARSAVTVGRRPSFGGFVGEIRGSDAMIYTPACSAAPTLSEEGSYLDCIPTTTSEHPLAATKSRARRFG